MTRLTLRRLNAMSSALGAMLAGQEGDGDWPEGVAFEDMDAAHSWVCEQIAKRERQVTHFPTFSPCPLGD